MLDPQQAKRLYSGVCHTNCILLMLNVKAFNILVKEKIKVEREKVASFVYNTIPGIYRFYPIARIVKGAHHLFHAIKFTKGCYLFKQGDRQDTLYIIKSGKVSLSKRITHTDALGYTLTKEANLLDLKEGELVGTDQLFSSTASEYSARVASQECVLMATKADNFRREYRRAVPALTRIFKARNKFLQQRSAMIE